MADSVPLIDLSQPDHLIVDQLRAAYEQVGFAGLVGHGVSPELVDRAFAEARRFHELPLADKLAISLNEHHRGFIGRGTSTDVASEYEQVTQPNHSESFMMLGPVPAGHFLSGPNQWPDLPGFESAMYEYHHQLTVLARRLIDFFAAALGEPLAQLFDMPTAWLRLLRYPSAAEAEAGYGSAPHRDYGAITLLAQDGVPGLEVLTEGGDWLAIDPDPAVLVLNTGEVMHRWSNGSLLRTPHRVINRSERERFSIPFFFDPDMRSVIQPLDSCVPAGQTPRFEPVSFEDFVRTELEAGYQRHRT